MTTKEQEYLGFWTALIAAGSVQNVVWQDFEPKKFDWIRIPSRKVSAVDYYIVVNQRSIRMELLINTRSRKTNYKIFNRLLAQKPEVEAAFGKALEWKPFNKVCKIMLKSGSGDYRERSDWPQLIEPTVQYFEPFMRTIQTHF